MRRLFVLIVAAALALVAVAVQAGADVVPYRMDASNQAGWWKPIDELGGYTYVAYNAWGSPTHGGSADTHTVYIARRDPSGRWVRGCLKAVDGACAVLTDDVGHHQPTIALDGDGYIHIFASMHGSPWRYYRSSRPHDPTSLVDMSATMPDQGTPITYPNATRAANGDIYLIVRNGRSGHLYRWDNAVKAWSRAVVFAHDPSYVVYPDDVIADAQGNVHIAWEWAYASANGLRHLGSYLRYEPATGRLSDAAGNGLDVPATPFLTSAVYQPVEPGESSTDRSAPHNPPGFQSAKLTLDPATGYPVAAYRFRPVAGGRFEVRLAEWDGASWRRSIVYAGKYTTYAAIDITFRNGAPRVYYAKTGVPANNQAFAATRQPDGRWTETLLLPSVPVERLAVVARGGTDYVYMAAPSQRQLHLRVG